MARKKWVVQQPPKSANIDPQWVNWLQAMNEIMPNDAHPGTGALSYSMLRQMARIPPIAAIITTRQNQVADFAHRQVAPGQLGWRIVHVDKNRVLTRSDRRTVEEIAAVIEHAGGDYYLGGFDSYLRATTRDTLTFDQVNSEVLREVSGKPYGFIPVDPSTMRRAVPDKKVLEDNRWDYEEIGYVQYLPNGGGVEAAEGHIDFQHGDMIWGIRRPRSWVAAAGYGHPELEDLVGVASAYVNSMTYNISQYVTGMHTNSVLTFKSKSARERYDVVRRQLESSAAGVRNSRRNMLVQLDPVLEEELKAVQLGLSPSEMQYSDWINMLIKIMCAHFAIDPSEINHVFGNEGAKVDMSKQSATDRILASKERGLRPILRAISQWLTFWVIKPHWPQYELEFVGFDAQAELARLEMNFRAVQMYITPNEVRAQYGMDPLPDPVSNRPLHGAYQSLLQMEQNGTLLGEQDAPSVAFDDVGAFIDGRRLPPVDSPA